ncbi:hypothetical protein [Catenuloplanes atrovinosus]|uniref:Uncharacterized protein n=1 Tax=Catenuloplanes atrovinosus TaxID=137266 RepID=A0AAE4CDA8_9ACTN|nr:hypothetical protein [Catenuloplanes atrovinosus]MDR7277335.1 hypothetical protein [Catenuloplanes atrovinosus]
MPAVVSSVLDDAGLDPDDVLRVGANPWCDGRHAVLAARVV